MSAAVTHSADPNQRLIDLPITSRFGVDVGGSFDVALPARGPASDGQGGLYPAEPRSFLRAQIALRYGAP